MTPAIRLKCRSAESASGVWNILIKEFESKDPERVYALRNRYDLLECGSRSISEFIDEAMELHDSLQLVGDYISDISLAGKLLRGLPANWKVTADMLRARAAGLKETVSALKAQEAVEEATGNNTSNNQHTACALATKPKRDRDVPTCDNCGIVGHIKANCYDIGGGKEGQWPKGWKHIHMKKLKIRSSYHSPAYTSAEWASRMSKSGPGGR
jgi:hypothetical protein